MGRKKKPEPDDKEQFLRFKETMEQVETEDAKERFEEAMKRVLFTKISKEKQTKDNLPKQDK